MSLDQPAPSLSRPLSREPEDLRFLRSLYLDCAGRTPLPAETQGHEGKTRGDAITALSGSPAFFTSLYEDELFYFLLLDNFRPSTDEFLTLPERLAQQQVSVKEALRLLVSSQFFNARNPGNDTFVTVVLEQLLGITVQKEAATLEAGKKMYDGKKVTFLGHKGENQADLVRIVVEDAGFEKFLLERKFEAVFGAAIPRKRLEADAARLKAEPLAYPRILGEWLSSEDYESLLKRPRRKSDRMFIQALFVDLLGRVAEYQEFRRCRNALLAMSDSTPLRSVLIKLVLDSGTVTIPEWSSQDRPGSVRGLFRRFLCRDPGDSELEVFVQESTKVDVITLVRALLTHPEYHVY